jgi:outer membrane protein
MKSIAKILSLVCFCLFISMNAQKAGVVDTEYILNKIPDYLDAKNRLDAQIDTWQKELQNLQSQYEKKRSAFENEKVLLVGDQLKLREKEVMDLEKSLKSTTSLRFGTNGEIATLRANLVQPFQDQIWTAVEAMSIKNGLGIVLDKNQNNVIFLQKKADYTDKVLDIILKTADTKAKGKK